MEAEVLTKMKIQRTINQEDGNRQSCCDETRATWQGVLSVEIEFETSRIRRCGLSATLRELSASTYLPRHDGGGG